MFEDFTSETIKVGSTHIFIRRAGQGRPLLLLHGFPQTHVMWHRLASQLAETLTVICADLRGYGRSGTPASDAHHTPYSKRAMALDMVQLMEILGFRSFNVVGHDRGGRVAYRMALDHPHRVQRLAVFDVLPTWDVLRHTDVPSALTFWPWSLLSQPAPLPEKVIGASPEAIIDDALSNWGSKAETFSAEARELYIEAMRNPQSVHAICEEYRAALTLDYEADEADLKSDRRITAPLLVLWAKGGALDTWYTSLGGPLKIWRTWANAVSGRAISGGHFFPEENPLETLAALEMFLNPY